MTFLALLQFHGPKSAYLGRVHAALLDFNELLSHTPVNLLLASLLHLPWVLDSGATDHISGNRSLSTYGYLPTITSTNGSQRKPQGIGTTHCRVCPFVT